MCKITETLISEIVVEVNHKELLDSIRASNGDLEYVINPQKAISEYGMNAIGDYNVSFVDMTVDEGVCKIRFQKLLEERKFIGGMISNEQHRPCHHKS